MSLEKNTEKTYIGDRHPKGLDSPLSTFMLPFEDNTFLFQSPCIPAMFYGTDINGTRLGYADSIRVAMRSRIAEPMFGLWTQRTNCFFKPYSSFGEGAGWILPQLLTATYMIVSSLGLFGTPFVLVAAACVPSILELIVGLVSLGQALFHKLKALYSHDEAEHTKAAEYLLDSVTRLALVIPLLVIGTLAIPVDFVRSLTRAVATLVDCVVTKPEVVRTSPADKAHYSDSEVDESDDMTIPLVSPN